MVDSNGHTLRMVTGAENSGDSWALRLGYTTEAERVFTKPLVVGGIVFFTTFMPDNGGCGGGGDTYVFALDYATGLPTTHAVFDLNGDGKFSDADKVEVTQADGTKVKVAPAGIRVGRGVGSPPVLFKNTLYITTTAPQYGVIAEGSTNVNGLHALAVNIPNNKVMMESWKHD
jgi:Tfp pilus tip-associated adhesin PilY1